MIYLDFRAPLLSGKRTFFSFASIAALFCSSSNFCSCASRHVLWCYWPWRGAQASSVLSSRIKRIVLWHSYDIFCCEHPLMVKKCWCRCSSKQ